MFFNLFNEKEQDDVSTYRRVSVYILIFLFYKGDVHKSTEGDTKMQGCWSSICLVKLGLDAANLSHDEPVLEAIVFFMMPIKRIKS